MNKPRKKSGRTWDQALRSYGSQTIRAHTRGGQGGPNGKWHETYMSTKHSDKEHCFQALIRAINAEFEKKQMNEPIPEPPLYSQKRKYHPAWTAKWKDFYDRNMKHRLDPLRAASAAPPDEDPAVSADEDPGPLEDIPEADIDGLIGSFYADDSPLASMLDDSESTILEEDLERALLGDKPSGAAMLDAGSSGTASTAPPVAPPVAPPAAPPAGHGSQKPPRDETMVRLGFYMTELHEALDAHLKAGPGCGHSQLRDLQPDETKDLRELRRALEVVLYQCAPEHCHVSIHRATHPCRCLHRRGVPPELALSPDCRGGNDEPSLFDQIRDVVQRLVKKIYQ